MPRPDLPDTSFWDDIERKKREDYRAQRAEESDILRNKRQVEEDMAMQRAKQAISAQATQKLIDEDDRTMPDDVWEGVERSLGRQKALFEQYADTLGENAKIDGYVEAGLKGKPIDLVGSMYGSDYMRESYIDARSKQSYVNYEDFTLGKWDPRINEVYNRDWKDDIRYNYVDYMRNDYQYWDEDPFLVSQGLMGETFDYSEDVENPGFQLWNQTMKKWQDNGVPSPLEQESAFKEIYGLEYDYRQATEGSIDRAINKFIKEASLGYAAPYEDLLGERSGYDKGAKLIGGLAGMFTGFAPIMKGSKAIISGGLKAVSKKLGKGQLVSHGVTAAQATGVRGSLFRTANWMQGASKGGVISNALAKTALGFNMHGQLYKHPDDTTIWDRVKQIPSDTFTGLMFGSVGQLGRAFEGFKYYKLAKGMEMPAIGMLGYSMAPDDPMNPLDTTDKWIHALAFMALHGMGMRGQYKQNKAHKKQIRKDLFNTHKRLSVWAEKEFDAEATRLAVDEVMKKYELRPSELGVIAKQVNQAYESVKGMTEGQYRAWKANESRRIFEEAFEDSKVDGEPVDTKTTELDKTRVPEEHTPSESTEAVGIPELDLIESQVLAIEGNPSNSSPLSDIDNSIADLLDNVATNKVILKDGKMQPVSVDEALELQDGLKELRQRAVDAIDNFAKEEKAKEKEQEAVEGSKVVKFTEDEVLDLGEGPISPKTGKVLKQFDRPVETEEQATAQIDRIDKWIESSEDKIADMNEGTAKHDNLSEQIDEAVTYRDNLYDLVESKKLDVEEGEQGKLPLEAKEETTALTIEDYEADLKPADPKKHPGLQERYENFKKDPIKVLEEDIKWDEYYLEQGAYKKDSQIARAENRLAEKKALLKELKKETPVETRGEQALRHEKESKEEIDQILEKHKKKTPVKVKKPKEQVVDLEPKSDAVFNPDIPMTSQVIDGVRYKFKKGYGYDESLLPPEAQESIAKRNAELKQRDIDRAKKKAPKPIADKIVESDQVLANEQKRLDEDAYEAEQLEEQYKEEAHETLVEEQKRMDDETYGGTEVDTDGLGFVRLKAKYKAMTNSPGKTAGKVESYAHRKLEDGSWEYYGHSNKQKVTKWRPVEDIRIVRRLEITLKEEGGTVGRTVQEEPIVKTPVKTTKGIEDLSMSELHQKVEDAGIKIPEGGLTWDQMVEALGKKESKEKPVSLSIGLAPVVSIKRGKVFSKLTAEEQAAVENDETDYLRDEDEIDSTIDDILTKKPISDEQLMLDIESETPFLGISPARLRLLGRSAVRTGRFLFKDLPRHIRRQAKKLKIDENNFGDAFEKAASLPKKAMKWLGKVLKHMRHWWKTKGRKLGEYNDWRRKADRRGKTLPQKELKVYTLKRNAIAHMIEDGLVKDGIRTRKQLADHKEHVLGTRSLATIMKKDADGNIIDGEADYKINVYIKSLKRYDNTLRTIQAGTLVRKDQQIDKRPKTVMEQNRDSEKDGAFPWTVDNYRDYKLTDPDLIKMSNKPSLYKPYGGSWTKQMLNAIGAQAMNVAGWADMIDQKFGNDMFKIIEKINWARTLADGANDKELNAIFDIVPDNFTEAAYGGLIERKLFDWRKIDQTRRQKIHAVGSGEADISELSTGEALLLEKIQDYLSDPKQQMKYMLLRFSQWQETGKAPKGITAINKKMSTEDNEVDIMADLQDALDTMGIDAMKELLVEYKEGFLIETNYMPSLDHVNNMENFNAAPKKQGFLARKGILKEKEQEFVEGDALENISRKIRATNRLYYLDPYVAELRDLLAVGDLPRHVQTEIEDYIRELYMVPTTDMWTNVMNSMSAQLLKAVFSTPKVIVRNYVQPLTAPIAYMSPKTAVKWLGYWTKNLFGKGSLRFRQKEEYIDMPENAQNYFWRVVAQERAWDTDMQQLSHLGILDRMGGIGRLLKSGIENYKWSDARNRWNLYSPLYKQMVGDIQHAYETGLTFSQKSKGYKGGKSLEDALNWYVVGTYKSMSDALLPEVEKAIKNGDMDAAQYVATRVAGHIAGPMINWDYHRTTRWKLEQMFPAFKPIFRLATFTQNVNMRLGHDAWRAYRGAKNKDKAEFFGGFRGTGGRLLSYYIMEEIILNTIMGMRDEDNEYHWGYQLPYMLIYQPGGLAVGHIKTILASIRAAYDAVSAPFREGDQLEDVSRTLSDLHRRYLPFYQFFTNMLESLYGKDKVKPIMEIYEGVAGKDGTYPQSDIDRDFWQFIQHAMFGGGYEEVDDD